MVGLKTARELAGRALVAVADGRDPAAEKKEARRSARIPADQDLIEKVVASFLANYAKRRLKEATFIEVKRILKNEIVDAWPKRKLSEIKRQDVHRLLDDIIERGAPYAANRALAWFKKLCSWSVERGIIEISPCATVTSPSPEKSRDRILNDEEIKAAGGRSDRLALWACRPNSHSHRPAALRGNRLSVERA